jgi:hypothetical protein
VLPRRVKGTATIIFDELLASYASTRSGAEAPADGDADATATPPGEVPEPGEARPPGASGATAAAPPASVGPEPMPPATGAAAGEPLPPALARLVEGLDDLAAYVADPAGFKDWEFMAQVTGLCEQLTEFTSRPGAMLPGGEWVARQVEEAFIALSLMQLEHGEQPCLDATTVLLQLARDLAWAEARRQEAA